MNTDFIAVWSNRELLKKLSLALLWIQVACVAGTIASSILRYNVDLFWTPIILGLIALICFAARYHIDRQAGHLGSTEHTSHVEKVAVELKDENLQLRSQITPLRIAFEPRRISHAQRDIILSILLDKAYVSPKPSIKLIVPPDDREAEEFAKALSTVLFESGHGNDAGELIRAKAQLQPPPDDPQRRLPHLYGVFSSSDSTVPDATLPGYFGSVKIFHASAITIGGGDTSHPRAYRYTENVNDILYGLSEVLQHAGFRVGRLSGYGILHEGQIGFYFPSQMD